MTIPRKIERDRLQADLATVEDMLDRFTAEDVVMRLGMEDRRDELREQLATFEDAPLDRTASAALFFGGAPVVGGRGIESEFGSRAVAIFQDLVAKQFAHDAGGLGQRGAVANKEATRLHITGVVRGSFGFRLEELSNQETFLDASLKASVDQIAHLIAAFGEDDEERFQTAIEDVDERVMDTAREFFGLMSHDHATLRIVVGDTDRSFDASVIERASRRASNTTVSDTQKEVIGWFAAALPDAHQFEFRAEDPDRVIRGRVDRALSRDDVVVLNRTWMEKRALAHFTVRRVAKEGRVMRESFTLRGLEIPPEAS